MADEEPDSTATAVETPPETPETPPVETSPPDALTQERERAIRAEAQAEAYKDAIRARPAAEIPKPTPPPQLPTLEQVDAALARGEIDQPTARNYERAIFRAEASALARQELEADRQRQKEQAIAEQLGTHLDARPSLSVPGSIDTRAVRAWIDKRGGDPESRSWQLAACDALFGEKPGGVVTVREHTRRKLLGSGGGGPASGDLPSGGGGGELGRVEKAFPAHVSADRRQRYLDHWQRRGYSVDEMVAEATYIQERLRTDLR